MSPTTWLNFNGALLTLNRFEVSAEPRPAEAYDKEMFQSRAALGIQSLLRMILDSTSRSVVGIPDSLMMLMTIWSIHRVGAAALLALEFGNDDDREEWGACIQSIKPMLKASEVRYKLAGILFFSSI